MRKAISALALATLAFMAVLAAAPPAAAESRGLTIRLKASEAAGAAEAGTVALYGASHALVIGIDAYTGGWPRLSNAVKDAEDVATVLAAQGFAVTLKKNLASADLKRAFEEFFAIKGEDPDARLFVWFAGHGYSEGSEGYIVPADAPRPDAGAAFWLGALSLRRFGEYVRLARSKHAFAVFDSCFAGTIFTTQRSLPPTAVTRATALPVRQFLTSGDAGQKVSDDGTFRKLFVRALRGEEPRADANGDGYLTASELGLFLEDRLTNLTRAAQTPRHGKLRDPDWDRGDFVFALPRVGVTPQAGTPSPPAASVDRELLFWQSIQGSANPADFRAYLEQFPNGTFAALARNRLAAMMAPPPAPAPSLAPPVKPAVGVYPGAPASGETFRDCPDCPEMVAVPAGSFVMGSPEEERLWAVSQGVKEEWVRPETPLHLVTIRRPFAVGRFEVTRGEFAAFVNDTGRDMAGGCHVWTGGRFENDATKGWRNPEFSQTDRDPVVCVSWDDAKAYVVWLSRRMGKGYRLLSEAEWEYAARAGSTSRYPFGDSEAALCEYGNAADRDTSFGWKNHSCSDGYGERTAPVGSFKPNVFGIHDTVGNVWEWVEDCSQDSYVGAVADGSAWTMGGDCDLRVLRGGSWDRPPGMVRSAYRGGSSTVIRSVTLGFRVARTF